MSAMICLPPVTRLPEIEQIDGQHLPLFVVWLDTNFGDAPSDWEMNTGPKPLIDALKEAAEVRLHGYPTQVVIDGETPRPDGFFSNPLTGE